MYLKSSLSFQGFPGNSAGKESASDAGDPSAVPGSGRSLGKGMGYPLQYSWASFLAQMVKNRLQCRKSGFDPWVGKSPWRRAWQPTPVFLPGESPWTEEPDQLQTMGLKRVGHDWATCEHTHTIMSNAEACYYSVQDDVSPPSLAFCRTKGQLKGSTSWHKTRTSDWNFTCVC